MTQPISRPTSEQVQASLKTVVDPEMGINIVDLGLVYGVRVVDNRIEIALTMTNPDRPTTGTMASEVEQTVRTAFEQIDDVEVSLVFQPPWTLDRLSEKAREALGVER